MKKLGFVIPWYGLDIPGGAEAELRGLTKHMHDAGVELEILTTCVKQFASDWSKNAKKAGTSIENGIVVRRFRVRKKRDTRTFAKVNAKLMKGQIPLTAEEEAAFEREMVNSPALYEYIRKHGRF